MEANREDKKHGPYCEPIERIFYQRPIKHLFSPAIGECGKHTQ